MPIKRTGCLAGVGLLLTLMTGDAGAQQDWGTPAPAPAAPQRNINSANFMLPHCKNALAEKGHDRAGRLRQEPIAVERSDDTGAMRPLSDFW